MPDILLIVPLTEEFAEIEKVFRVTNYVKKEGEFIYELAPNGVSCTIAAAILGEPGAAPAASRVERLISVLNPQLVVVIGIAGSLSKDLKLGDVVVAEEVDHYLANSKAVDGPAGTFQLRTSGRHIRTNHPILQIVRNFQFAGRSQFEHWQGECKDRTSSFPKYELGRVACGDSVGDSQEFKNFLLSQIDRKSIALEMESSGVAESTFSRDKPIPLLVLRGISDLATNKSTLDEASNGLWRRAAAQNAASFLDHLLRWPEFITVLSRDSNEKEDNEHSNHLRSVIAFMERHDD